MTVRTLGNGAALLFFAWVVLAAAKAMAETIIVTRPIGDPSPEASLLRIAARILGFLLASWVMVRGLQDLGADLLPILAGLGVGSLVIALAAQRTLANILGSLILFINKPVKVGDFCRYGDRIGLVEEIGWISTRIRSLERAIVTVPNAEFSEMQLDNFAARDERLFKTVLNLRYETTPDQIRYILIQLRQLLLGHPMVSKEPARAGTGLPGMPRASIRPWLDGFAGRRRESPTGGEPPQSQSPLLDRIARKSVGSAGPSTSRKPAPPFSRRARLWSTRM